MGNFQRIPVIDTHTGGEPTRVVLSGAPELRGPSLSEMRDSLATEWDGFRSSVVNEPRGSDVMVGALLVPPSEPGCCEGVIFFNNVGYLGMCGHGTIGVAVALGHTGRLKAGVHRFETPVGIVTVQYDGENSVSFENVPSYCFASDVTVGVPGYGKVVGDIAWGGNWFFLVDAPQETLAHANVEHLTAVTWQIRKALEANGITGKAGGLIDHIELFGPAVDPGNHSRSFVLCPGKAYDRSPCGTGTSAKLACLHARGKLKPGEVWRQESVVGSVFEGWYRAGEGAVIPTIRGSAYVVAESTLLIDPTDPFGRGIR